MDTDNDSAMSSQMKIYCKNIREYVPFTGGETLSEIYGRMAGRIGFQPICARVNNKTEDLQYPVFAPKQVEFLPVESASGASCVCQIAVHDALSGCRGLLSRMPAEDGTLHIARLLLSYHGRGCGCRRGDG